MKNKGMAAILGALVIFAGISCGGSGAPAPSKTISTDTTVNRALLTDFTGPNSVTIAGTWTNTTYESTGDVTVNVVFDTATNIATINFDIDGNVVYGGADPDAETFTLDMTDLINNGTATLTFTSAVYGDVTATLTFYTDGTGVFSGTAENAPNPAVTNASFSGTFETSGSAVTFTIDTAQFEFGGIPITCTSNLTTTIN